MTRPPSKSYLLRLWREHAGAPLRATLIDVTQPDTQQHFATLEALVAFLQAGAGPAIEQSARSDSQYCTPQPSEAEDSSDAR
jgi:hypothetical protein